LFLVFLFQVTSEFGSNPYRGFAVAFRVVLITKQSRAQAFRSSGAFCFLFEFGGIAGVPFSIGKDYSSAGLMTASLIRRAGAWFLEPSACAQQALAELCGLYWRPPYAFARRRGHWCPV
jgi:hypothetical protein